jgi:hypothetical protein
VAVEVDGRSVGTSIYVPALGFRDYMVGSVELQPGSHGIQVSLLNDFFDPINGGDLNLFADRITLQKINNAVPARIVLEAEQMQLGPGVIRGGEGALFSTISQITTSFDVPASGFYKILVIANGQEGGPQLPQMRVSVDGLLSQVIHVPNNRGQIEYIAAGKSLDAGHHSLSVALLNDYYGPTGDLNLIVDKVIVEPLDRSQSFAVAYADVLVDIDVRMNGATITQLAGSAPAVHSVGRIDSDRLLIANLVPDNAVVQHWPNGGIVSLAGYSARSLNLQNNLDRSTTSSAPSSEGVIRTHISDRLESVLQQHRRNIYARIATELNVAGPLHDAAKELVGIRNLIQAYLTLGAGDLLQGNDLARVLIYGRESLPSIEDLTAFYQQAAAGTASTERADAVAVVEERLGTLEELLSKVLSDVDTLKKFQAFSDVARTLQSLQSVKYLVATSPPGDYDYDGETNGSDFLAWQRTLGSIANLAADGNRDSIVNAADLALWKSVYPKNFEIVAGDYNVGGTPDLGPGIK